jgi:hypothetical protein
MLAVRQLLAAKLEECLERIFERHRSAAVLVLLVEACIAPVSGSAPAARRGWGK